MSGGVVAERLGRQYLYAYVAVEVFIAGAIDFTHATTADLLHNAVVAECLAAERISARHLGAAKS